MEMFKEYWLKNQRSLHKNMWKRGTALSDRINQSIILGIPTPPCADRWRWCTDSCSKEAKHTETQYLTWFGKLLTSTGEVNIIRDIEKKVTTHMEKEDHFTQTLLLALSHCCTWQPLFLSYSLHILTTLSHFALSRCLFIGKNGATAPALLQ